jgi:nucleoside-diphosphate-sugar epimerase
MKALVTGSNGFLGVALTERLIARNAGPVHCLVRSGSNTRRLERVLSSGSGAEMVTGSLASPEAAAAAIDGVDVVYHLAATLRGSTADLFLGTVVTSKHLLEAVRASGRLIRLVLVSSFSVYGVAGLRRGSLVDELTPLEPHPELRDSYAQAKLRQELLFREYAERLSLPLVVLRPGVIYGPEGGAMSARVGLSLPGVFLHLGGGNTLPLSYVDNCAEAVAAAGATSATEGETYNVLDDDLVTSRSYLRRFKRGVGPLRSLFVPYPVLRGLARGVLWYHRHSRGQLPALLTPYRVASTWKRMRFENAKLRRLEWQPLISTEEGLRRTFERLKERREAGERVP